MGLVSGLNKSSCLI